MVAEYSGFSQVWREANFLHATATYCTALPSIVGENFHEFCSLRATHESFREREREREITVQDFEKLLARL